MQKRQPISLSDRLIKYNLKMSIYESVDSWVKFNKFIRKGLVRENVQSYNI